MRLVLRRELRRSRASARPCSAPAAAATRTSARCSREQAIARARPGRRSSTSTRCPDDALVVPSAMMGAPTVMVEKLPRGDEIVARVQGARELPRPRITHTVSVEAGGLNSTTPFTVAAQLGMPLVDADVMGRAFPELQMCTPTLSGIVGDADGDGRREGQQRVINTIANRWTERIARSLTIDMGCSAMIALYAMTGGQLKEALVPGTLSLRRGDRPARPRDARARTAIRSAPCRAARRASRSSSGKIVDVARRTEAGFARGEARIEGGGDADSTLELDSRTSIWSRARRRDRRVRARPDHRAGRRDRRADHDRGAALRLPRRGARPRHATRAGARRRGSTLVGPALLRLRRRLRAGRGGRWHARAERRRACATWPAVRPCWAPAAAATHTVGRLLVEQAMAEGGRVTVLDPDEVATTRSSSRRR